MIVLNNIKKYYQGNGDSCVRALDGVSLQIEDGEMVAVIGASGSGKSTLLNIIGGLDRQTEGEYTIDGMSVNKCNFKQLAKLRNKTFGFVIQDFAVVSDWTVYQNVELPLVYSKKKKTDRRETMDKILRQLGIYDKRSTPVRNLSGGQKQRVAIARAIVNDPQVILADEPTGALDSATGLEVLKILKDINAKGRTVIIVTHNPQIAKACDRIIHIKDGKLA